MSYRSNTLISARACRSSASTMFENGRTLPKSSITCANVARAWYSSSSAATRCPTSVSVRRSGVDVVSSNSCTGTPQVGCVDCVEPTRVLLDHVAYHVGVTVAAHQDQHLAGFEGGVAEVAVGISPLVADRGADVRADQAAPESGCACQCEHPTEPDQTDARHGQSRECEPGDRSDRCSRQGARFHVGGQLVLIVVFENHGVVAVNGDAQVVAAQPQRSEAVDGRRCCVAVGEDAGDVVVLGVPCDVVESERLARFFGATRGGCSC